MENDYGKLNEYEEVTFIDEDGSEQSFLHIMTFNYEVDEDEPEVLFVKIIHDDEGDAYIPVDNDVLLEELFAEFAELLEESEETDEEE